MLRQQLNENGRVVRRVTVSPTLAISVTDASESWLPTKWDDPDTVSDVEVPRNQAATLLSYVVNLRGLAGAFPLQVGDRVERRVNDTIYELIREPVPVKTGRRTEGFKVRVLPVGSLYPVTATLEEQGGDDVQTDVPFALWNGSENKQSEGDYFTHSGAAPLEFHNQLRPNRALNVGGELYRILEAIVNHQLRNVELSLRSVRD